MTRQDNLQPLAHAAMVLEEKGLDATYEYPGFLRIILADGNAVNVGTANGGYGMDGGDGEVVYDFHMPLTATVDALVEAIDGWISKQFLSPYAKEILDAALKAMEPAEGMYMDVREYVPLMEAIAYEANQRIHAYRANNGGTASR